MQFKNRNSDNKKRKKLASEDLMAASILWISALELPSAILDTLFLFSILCSLFRFCLYSFSSFDCVLFFGYWFSRQCQTIASDYFSFPVFHSCPCSRILFPFLFFFNVLFFFVFLYLTIFFSFSFLSLNQSQALKNIQDLRTIF